MMSVTIATIVTGCLWVCTEREREKMYIKREQGISRYKDGVLIVWAIECSVALVLCLIPILCFNCHAMRPQTITQQYRVTVRFHLQWYFLFYFYPSWVFSSLLTTVGIYAVLRYITVFLIHIWTVRWNIILEYVRRLVCLRKCHSEY